MGRGALLRPAPLLIVFLFAAVAVVDLVHYLRYPPAPLPNLLVSGELAFEPSEPVIDLRGPQQQTSVGSLPVATLESDLPTLGGRQPAELDAKREVLTVRRSGRLTVPFDVDDRIDALTLRYRFVGGEGRGEVVVARPEGGGPGRDAPLRKVLEVDQKRRIRVRVPLHGLAGGFVLTLAVDLHQDSSRLVIDDLRLVAEGASDPRNQTGPPR